MRRPAPAPLPHTSTGTITRIRRRRVPPCFNRLTKATPVRTQAPRPGENIIIPPTNRRLHPPQLRQRPRPPMKATPAQTQAPRPGENVIIPRTNRPPPPARLRQPPPPLTKATPARTPAPHPEKNTTIISRTSRHPPPPPAQLQAKRPAPLSLRRLQGRTLPSRRTPRWIPINWKSSRNSPRKFRP